MKRNGKEPQCLPGFNPESIVQRGVETESFSRPATFICTRSPLSVGEPERGEGRDGVQSQPGRGPCAGWSEMSTGGGNPDQGDRRCWGVDLEGDV